MLHRFSVFNHFWHFVTSLINILWEIDCNSAISKPFLGATWLMRAFSLKHFNCNKSQWPHGSRNWANKYLLRCCQHDFFIFLTHRCICSFRGPDKKKVDINLLSNSRFPFECLQDRTHIYTFFYYLPPFQFSLSELWWQWSSLFFISLWMRDYKGLYFVKLKPISDHCEGLVASLEPWGSPLTRAAPESMRETTNRRYHCTRQTAKTSSAWEGNNNPWFSIDFSTTA